MSFQAFLGLVLTALGGPLLVREIERYCDRQVARARAEQERSERELDMRLRLHEMEQYLAVGFADEVRKTYGHLKAEVDYNHGEGDETGFVVTVSAEPGERRILSVIFDLRKQHSAFPMILMLADNPPHCYQDVDMFSVQAMEVEASHFINAVVTPATVH